MSLNFSGNTPSMFGARPLTDSGPKKFLSGRPSLHDILAIAPEWETAFKTIHTNLQKQDKYIDTLKTKMRALRTTSEECKEELSQRENISKINSYTQDTLTDEIDEEQPLIRKLNRQVHSLTSACQRLLPSGMIGGSLVMVPQPEYVRFVEELNRRTYDLQNRSNIVFKSIESAKKEIKDEGNSNLETEIKNVLTLLFNLYKQLKLRHLGLQEELKSLTNKNAASADMMKNIHL